jgi:hypothetical protein
MTNKQTFWLADAEGTRALVEGADTRDRFIRIHGWTEAAEPQRQDFVWLRHEDPALGATRMTWEAAQLDAWAGRGWTPGAPPEPGAAVEPEPPKSSPVKTSAPSGDKKE